MTSTRHGEARSALREVQSRHQDIQKIERTITELAQLFNEMSIMIEVQEAAIDNIEQKAQETETHVESGLQATEQAVVSARAARRKKWWCLGLILLIISTTLTAPLPAASFSEKQTFIFVGEQELIWFLVVIIIIILILKFATGSI